MAASVTQGATSTSLAYDDQHQRIRQTTTGTGAGDTIYLNDPTSAAMSERVTTTSGTIWGSSNWGAANWGSGATSSSWVDYILLDGKIVAQRNAPTSGSASTNYFLLDHLGSVTLITDGSGSIVQRLAYDAWGKRRNNDGTDAACGAITVSATTRGYTDQEMMPAQCLINLNARLYDPSIGKFMAPDSIVPDPFDGQSYNRYAYVNSNPLRFTDPTGNYPDDGDVEKVIVTGLRSSTQTGIDPGVPFSPNATLYAALSGGVAPSLQENSVSTSSTTLGQQSQMSGAVDYTTIGSKLCFEVGSCPDNKSDSGGVNDDSSAGNTEAYENANVYEDGGIATTGGQVQLAMSFGARLGARVLSLVPRTLGTAPKVANPKLKNAMSSLFRRSDKIPGGTAGAIRSEKATGGLVGGKSHVIKGEQSIRRLERIIKQEPLNSSDRRIAEEVIRDLRDALAGK